MPSVVTLHIYSGRQDPSWELDPPQVAILQSLLSSPRGATFAKPSTVASRLGYRGFSVESSRVPLPALLTAGGGIVEETRQAPSLVDNDKEIERFLLETGKPYLTPKLVANVERELAGPHLLSNDVTIFAAPPYNPGKWNDDPYILDNNNCYNYACDRITNSRAQPGVGSGAKFHLLACGDVGAASVRDGLTSVAGPNGNPAPNSHFAALVMAPDVDFHWYRFDTNGRWSHKPGRTRATDLDQAGRVILNPEIADRGAYVDFCGYYLIDTTKVRIE
ncbi:hypothetical protein [Burkholderia sp. Ac-20365]|uniref:hypothetical protein n=1 Tax=Burkholderia sp. Ac-20365 TaxID=2703897 RepID=UPI00197C26E6|nr:hypothetical protein [Burkholderia sp. Ac-20365]MBN3760725.1 hypothetical protein [Burkholderia sp. Ac-20365]